MPLSCRSRKRVASFLRSPILEGLETRRLLSASVLDHHGVLRVTGTSHNDTIDVSSDAQQTVVNVSVNGVVKTYNWPAVRSLRVNGGAGADNITLDASLAKPATVLGGAGNDNIIGDNADDSLSGGAGNDTIVGGSGDDRITGDAGDDSVNGGAGNDSLSGGKGHDAIDCGTGNDNVQLTKGAGVAFSTLPAAVQTGLTTLASGAKITTVQSFTEEGATFYATQVTIAGKLTRIAVDASGNPVTFTPEDHGGHHGNVNGNRTFGTLVGVDATAGTITVAVASEHGTGAQTTFTVASGAAITVDGAASSLASLPTGVVVSLKTDAANPTTVTAISATGKHVEGIVTAVDATAGTITFTPEENSASQTFNVSSTATIEVNGASATLASITAGMRVEATLSTSDATTLVALEAGQGDHGGGGQNHGGNDDGPGHH